MGTFSGLGQKIASIFSRDKDKAAEKIAAGVSGPFSGVAGYDPLSNYNFDIVSSYLRLEHDLYSRYLDYEEMDDYPEISAALDILADDATQIDTVRNKSVWVTSPNKRLEGLLDHFFNETLRVDDELWDTARSLVKYGNDFEELLVTDEGVVGMHWLPTPTMRRVEGFRGELYGFLQDMSGRRAHIPVEQFQELLKKTRNPNRSPAEPTAFEDWEVVHMRLRGKHRNGLYGVSPLEAARWVWRRLILLEDAALVYRLQRSPERLAFYIETGDLPPKEALAWVNQVRQNYRKKKFINPATGKLELKWDAISPDEDYFIPTREGQDGARIESITSPSWQSIDDIEYFKQKLLAALKVPGGYLAQEEAVSKAVLSSQDVQFARSVLRIQRELTNGLGKAARVHLAALGIDPYEETYDIHMTTPSSIFELAQIEVQNARADLAQRLGETVTRQWILEKVLHLSEDDIANIFQQSEDEKIFNMSADAKAMKAGNEIMPGFNGMMPPGPEAGAEGGGFEGETPVSPTAFSAPAEPAPSTRQQQQATEAIVRRATSKEISSLRRDLFTKNKYQNAKLDKKFAKLIQSDRLTAMKLGELGNLLHELKGARSR